MSGCSRLCGWAPLATLVAGGGVTLRNESRRHCSRSVVGGVAGIQSGSRSPLGSITSPAWAQLVLTFLAGTDIDPHVVRKNLASSVTIGLVGFFAPYIGCLLLARYGLGWPWPQAQIGGALQCPRLGRLVLAGWCVCRENHWSQTGYKLRQSGFSKFLE